MINNKFAKDILEKIEEKKIKPKPKWEFLLKNYIIWIFGVLSLIIGSLAVSVIIYMLRHNDWEIYENVTNSLLEFILVTLPYFWLIVLVFFILAADYNLKHTKKGYKYNLSLIIAVSLGVNVVFGVLLYNFGIGQAIDDILGENAPFYREIINRRVPLWDHPEEGRLMGKIIKIESIDKFMIQDFRQGDWMIDAKDARIMPMIKIEIGEDIRIVGEPFADHQIKAFIIMPMGPGRGFLKRMPFIEREMIEICPQNSKFLCPEILVQ